MIPSRARSLGWATVACACILAAGCEPPGKPSPSEVEDAGATSFTALFATNCSGCHGENGRQGPARVLNDAVYLAVTPKDAVRNILINGRPGSLMPPWAQSNGGPLTNQQIEILVNGIYGWAKPFNPGSPLPDYHGAGLTGDPAQGKKLFLRGCFACHAPGGIAGALTPSYLALSTNENLRTSIIVGRPDLIGVKMPNYLSLNAGHALSDQNIADLVSYLSSMRPGNSQIAQALEKTSTAAEKDAGTGKGEQ